MPTIRFTTEVPVLVDEEEDWVMIEWEGDVCIDKGNKNNKREVINGLGMNIEDIVDDFTDTDYLNDNWEEHFEKNFEYEIEWDDEEEQVSTDE